VAELAGGPGAGIRVGGIRIDSGDLDVLSRQAREILDRAGLEDVRVLVSGDLDETRIAALVGARAPVDGFGIGTQLVTSADAPALNCAYKLVDYAGTPRMKLSSGKVTLPGPKQVLRQRRDGRFAGDIIALAGEALEGEPLLRPVMEAWRGEPGASPDLAQLRAECTRQVAVVLRSLPEAPAEYPVTVSPARARETRRTRQALSACRRDPAPG